MGVLQTKGVKWAKAQAKERPDTFKRLTEFSFNWSIKSKNAEGAGEGGKGLLTHSPVHHAKVFGAASECWQAGRGKGPRICILQRPL